MGASADKNAGAWHEKSRRAPAAGCRKDHWIAKLGIAFENVTAICPSHLRRNLAAMTAAVLATPRSS